MNCCGSAQSFSDQQAAKSNEHTSLQLNVRSVGGVAVVDCKGRLAFGEGLDSLYETAGRLLNGKQQVLLNFAEVQGIDAAGIGVLADLAAHASEWGGQIRFCNVPQAVEEVISLTHLAGALECYETERDGLASYLGLAAFWRAS